MYKEKKEEEKKTGWNKNGWDATDRRITTLAEDGLDQSSWRPKQECE